MSKRKKGGYLGGHTVLTQSRGSYEAEMERAAQRAKRRARLDQQGHDAERSRRLERKLKELAKFAPRPSRPVMPASSLTELNEKYPEGVPQWMLGHSPDEIDRLMQLRRKKATKGRSK